jgi:hypothetical protein
MVTYIYISIHEKLERGGGSAFSNLAATGQGGASTVWPLLEVKHRGSASKLTFNPVMGNSGFNFGLPLRVHRGVRNICRARLFSSA